MIETLIFAAISFYIGYTFDPLHYDLRYTILLLIWGCHLIYKRC